MAYNHQGQRAGRPHVAAWAETEIVLAADLGDGTDDPRATAPGLLRRALAALPRPSATGRPRRGGWRCAPTPATSPGSWPAPPHEARHALRDRRQADRPAVAALAGIADDAWHDAIDMDNAQVAVSPYCPDWWPAAPGC